MLGQKPFLEVHFRWDFSRRLTDFVFMLHEYGLTGPIRMIKDGLRLMIKCHRLRGNGIFRQAFPVLRTDRVRQGKLREPEDDEKN